VFLPNIFLNTLFSSIPSQGQSFTTLQNHRQYCTYIYSNFYNFRQQNIRQKFLD
jgi:hypothetical protein